MSFISMSLVCDCRWRIGWSQSAWRRPQRAFHALMFSWQWFLYSQQSPPTITTWSSQDRYIRLSVESNDCSWPLILIPYIARLPQLLKVCSQYGKDYEVIFNAKRSCHDSQKKKCNKYNFPCILLLFYKVIKNLMTEMFVDIVVNLMLRVAFCLC